MKPKVITLTLSATDAIYNSSTELRWSLKNLPLLNQIAKDSVLLLRDVQLGTDTSAVAYVELGLSGFSSDSVSASGAAPYDIHFSAQGMPIAMSICSTMPAAATLADPSILTNALIRLTLINGNIPSTSQSPQFSNSTRVGLIIREPGAAIY